MFRTLFISLLILSTLTSEGIINIPGNIYNFYLCSQNELELTGEQVFSCEQNRKEADFSRPLPGNRLINDAFILTARSFQLIDAKLPVDNTGFEYKNDLRTNTTELVSRTVYKIEKEIVLQKSDLSPPLSLSI